MATQLFTLHKALVVGQISSIGQYPRRRAHFQGGNWGKALYFRYVPLQGLYDSLMPHSFGLTLHPIHSIGSLNLHQKTRDKFISVLRGHLICMNIPHTPIHVMIYICLDKTFSNQIRYEQMGKFFKRGVGLSSPSLRSPLFWACPPPWMGLHPMQTPYVSLLIKR
jgi:hypothetical protein